VTTRDSAGATMADALARAVALLAEASLVLSRVAVRAEAAPEPESPVLEHGYAAPARVLSVHARPTRAGEPQQVALWVQQVGPLPPPEPVRLWVTVTAGEALPEEGQQCTLVVQLHPFL
jgi:hypothetical protein